VLESELRKAKNTATNAEKARKADLAQCKLRYEQRVAAIGDEIKSVQAQLTRYKRERDTYKQMLEGAQKTITELKSARSRKQSSSSIGKSDEVRRPATAVLQNLFQVLLQALIFNVAYLLGDSGRIHYINIVSFLMHFLTLVGEPESLFN
jgi:chromosome segregation ATPase